MHGPGGVVSLMQYPKTFILGLLALMMPPVMALAQAPATKPAPVPAAVSAPAPAKPTPVPLDGPAPQVRVEARILEWQINDSLDYDFAVQYNRDPGSGGILGSADLTLPAEPSLSSAARVFLGNMDAGNGTFEAVIEALKGVGQVRILSQPSIILTSQQVDPTKAPPPPAIPYSSSSGMSSVISSSSGSVTSVGAKPAVDTAWPAGSARLTNISQVPYALNQFVGYNVAEVTQYRDVGVALDVLVQCVKDNLVFLDTRVSVSDVSGFISIARDAQNNPQTVPMIDSRAIQNRLVIPDRTIFIAGLMKTTREQERRSGIPWLSELPGLRWLLSNRKKVNVDSELVFLIKPEIMSPYQPDAQEGSR